MKLPRHIFLFFILAEVASAQETVIPTPAAGARADWVATRKKNDPKSFAARYGWIDVGDGVDDKESEAIAALFFYSTGSQCGVVSKPNKVGYRWKSEAALGPFATPMKPIWVDAKTGAVWQEGGDRIEDVGALLRTAAKK